MTRISINRRARLGTALAALALSVGTVAVASPAAAAPRPGTFKPTGEVLLSDASAVRGPAAGRPHDRAEPD